MLKLGMLVMSLLLSSANGFAHCQIPCGIYHNDLVFQQLEQNVETLQKGAQELQNSQLPLNQAVRWVMNKEDQANQIAEVMLTYFLQQQIKENDPQKAEKLNVIHSICLTCTKVKQTIDPQVIETLKGLLGQLRALYTPVKV